MNKLKSLRSRCGSLYGVKNSLGRHSFAEGDLSVKPSPLRSPALVKESHLLSELLARVVTSLGGKAVAFVIR